MKDELGEKIMKEFAGLRAKTYSYLIDIVSEDKKAKGRENLNFKLIKIVQKQCNLRIE